MSENIIYALKDPTNDEFRYVGKSTQGIRRAKSHLSYSHNPLIREWIEYLLSENHTPEIIILEEVADWLHLKDKEEYWIGKLLSDGYDLLNVMSTHGYDSSINEIKQKIKQTEIALQEKLKQINDKANPGIGETIKQRRKQLGLRQPDLADIAGVSVNTVYKTERNFANPSMNVLIKILDVLGMELFIVIKKTNTID